MKTITICDKQYPIECNAYTHMQYKKIFNKGIIEDVEVLKDYLITETLTIMELKEKNPEISEIKLTEKLNEVMTPKIDDFIDVVTRIAYIEIYCADNNIEDYETFLKGIKTLRVDDDWIAEVTELAVDCFR